MSETRWIFCPWCSNKHGWGVGGTTVEHQRVNLARLGFKPDTINALSVNQMLALSHFRDYDTPEAIAREIHRIKELWGNKSELRTRLNLLRTNGEMTPRCNGEYNQAASRAAKVSEDVRDSIELRL